MSLIQKILVGFLIPCLFIVLAASFVFVMAFFSPTAENSAQEEVAFPIEVMVVEPLSHQVQLTLTGTVESEQQVGLSTEVSGRVTHVSEGLRPGRRYRKGERIFRIDSRDYEAALTAESARLRGAELELAVEENRQTTAAREVELVGGNDGNSLALRKPHLESAKANLLAAQKAEERAALNVERTSLRAPFNGIVVSESVDVGQWVGPGAVVVQMVGTDAVRILASIPVDQLEHLILPTQKGKEGLASRPSSSTDAGSDIEGSQVTVIHRFSEEKENERKGWVTGLVGRLDAQTRTATLVVTVPNPYAGEGPPLLPGAFVSLRVDGRWTEDVFEVPHKAISQNRLIWVDDNGALAERNVVVGWRTAGKSYVVSGLVKGDRIITTSLSLPIKGMKVKAND